MCLFFFFVGYNKSSNKDLLKCRNTTYTAAQGNKRYIVKKIQKGTMNIINYCIDFNGTVTYLQIATTARCKLYFN